MSLIYLLDYEFALFPSVIFVPFYMYIFLFITTLLRNRLLSKLLRMFITPKNTFFPINMISFKQNTFSFMLISLLIYWGNILNLVIFVSTLFKTTIYQTRESQYTLFALTYNTNTINYHKRKKSYYLQKIGEGYLLKNLSWWSRINMFDYYMSNITFTVYFFNLFIVSLVAQTHNNETWNLPHCFPKIVTW